MSNPRIKVGFVTPPYAAWVPNGNTIIIADPKYATNRTLIAHELAHVKQARKFGPFYLLAYAIGFIRAGFSYQNNWMEVEARKAETDPRMLAWAKKVIYEHQNQ